MSKLIDLTGRRFGSLLVTGLHPVRSATGHVRWNCLCDCQNTSVVQGGHLVGGRTSSCGCSQKTHGLRNSPEYLAWANMIQRCRNPNNPMYSYYGGRGIMVDARWVDSFESFYADMGPRPSSDHSIERRDVNGSYGPENCYWATTADQANNTRRNVFYEFRGQTKTESQLARDYGLSPQTLRQRLGAGLGLEEALTKPLRPTSRNKSDSKKS